LPKFWDPEQTELSLSEIATVPIRFQSNPCQSNYLLTADEPIYYPEHQYKMHHCLIQNSVLNSDAFYIGAQGSKSAHRQLVNNLIDMGCSENELAQLRSQIGLIPSARDPKTLAISVLADIIKYSNLNQ
jgi:xanthine dehydrogenase accessory factor